MSVDEVICDYSSSHLNSIPKNVFALPHLRMLYLDRNQILALPEDFFQKLPNLYWLDLRGNRIERIPIGIAHHKHLENLLLQENNIIALPKELGLVPNLRVLQLEGNPLEYPPEEIIEAGFDEIISFLNQECAKSQAQREHSEDSESAGLADAENSTVTDASEGGIYPRTGEMDDLQIQALPLMLVNNFNKQVANRRKAYWDSKCSKQSDRQNKSHQITRTPLGIAVHSRYKNSYIRDILPSTAQMNAEQMKNIWTEKLKELVSDQERIIQQEKTMKALESWRSDKKEEDRLKTFDCEASSFEMQAPFDTNETYNAYMSRTDLTQQIERALRSQQPAVKDRDIEDLITDVVNQLQIARDNAAECKDPAAKLKIAEKELQLIANLNRKISEGKTKTFI